MAISSKLSPLLILLVICRTLLVGHYLQRLARLYKHAQCRARTTVTDTLTNLIFLEKFNTEYNELLLKV
jgi:hypothetical protein